MIIVMKKKLLDDATFDLLLSWAVVHLDKGAYDKAELIFSELGRLDPQRAVPWAGAALAAMLKGDEKAAEDYRIYLDAICPLSPLRRKVNAFFSARRARPGKQKNG